VISLLQTADLTLASGAAIVLNEVLGAA